MRLRLLIAAGVGALVAFVAIVAVVLTHRPASAVRVQSTGFAGATRPPGMPPAAFALRDEDGRVVRAAALRGRVVALMFLYSTCRDTCPVTAQQVRGALDEIGRGDVTALAVSVDPGADTRANVRRFLLVQRLVGRVHYLRAPRTGLARVWREFGVAPQRRGREHSVSVVLLDRRGHQRVGFGADDVTVDNLAHDLRALAA